MTQITAKYPGQCKACGKHHIKAGQPITLGPTGWADIKCIHALNRTTARSDRQQHTIDKAQADALGLHLYDYYNMPRIELDYNNEELSWTGIEEFH